MAQKATQNTRQYPPLIRREAIEFNGLALVSERIKSVGDIGNAPSNTYVRFSGFFSFSASLNGTRIRIVVIICITCA